MSNASRFLCAFLWIGFALPSLQAKPQFTSDVLKVEEDWEMVLGEPDPLQDSPQISTWMSPTDAWKTNTSPWIGIMHSGLTSQRVAFKPRPLMAAF